MLGEPRAAEPFRNQIQRALDHAGNVMMIEDLYAFVLTGDMQLWIDKDSSGILFTEVVCYPRTKAVRAVVAAGSLNGIKSMIPKICRWALQQGCQRAELMGRNGWKGVLSEHWESRALVMTAECKDLAE